MKILNDSILSRLDEISKSLLDSHGTMRCRHFSFILYKGRLISTGINCSKTHPVNLINRKVSKITGLDFSDQKHTCSEFVAILKLKRLTNIDTSKCVMVNIRYDRNDNKAMAKPCMSCQNLLRYHSFKHILWTDDNGNFVSS